MKRNTGEGTVLLLISLCFLLGGAAGSLAAGASAPRETMERFLADASRAVSVPELHQEVWGLLRWPVLILILGKLPLPGVTIPAALFLRGFLLSYGISYALLGNGTSGWVVCLSLFGPDCLLTVPVMFVLCAYVRNRRTEAWRFQRFAAVLGFSAGALTICGLLDRWIIPIMLSALLKTI